MPVGDFVVVERFYWSCVVTFCAYKTRADLLFLDIIDFEFILGMDWLSPYHSILDCHAKTIILAMVELPRLEWRGSSIAISSQVIPFLKARHMVEKGCLAYLAFVHDTAVEIPTIDSVHVVWELFDVFLADVLGMPPDRGIDFGIDLEPGTHPIFILPYCIALVDLRELKEKLLELLKKGFIRPSVSP
ncbi:uncharacterized protein [Nicotiana tomentosiformis]|uniref:uncharacterized protein n=1 Tax=Nicotiana tomentosiformis TaxID=4098 RepID=UPI00388C8070